MAGLFDFLNDPDTAGLLGGAGAILNASGPSLMPRSFGQIIGAGLGGMQQAQDQQMKLAQMRQLGQINDLKIKDATSDLKNQDMLRERTRQINEELLKRRLAGGASMSMPSPQSAGSLFSGMMAGQQPYSHADGQAAYDAAGAAGIANPTPTQLNQFMAGARQNAAQPARQPQPADLNEASAQRLLQEAEVYAQYGDFDGANKRYEAAVKLQPKYSTDFRTARGDDGQLHNYVLADNGKWKDTGLGVKPEMTEMDLGGTKQFIDKNAVTPGQVFNKTMTFADRQSASRLAFDKSQADGNQDAAMDPLAIRMTAQQYLAGDAGALQNFGRGAQGARNLNAVRLEVAKQANSQGLNGADIAAKMAEFSGVKAGQRTAGTRSASIEIAANEAAELAPLAVEASRKVARSGFLPFGKAQVMFDQNANDPNLRQFAMANTALSNAYSQVMSRGGVATDSDKQHARELLSVAHDQPSYEAAVAQMTREIQAAQRAPGKVKEAISAGVTGKGGHDARPAPKSVLKGQVMDGYKFKGGNPADPTAWEKL